MRHGLQDTDACALSDQGTESVEHLFLGCVMARQVWFYLLQPLHLDSLTPVQEAGIGAWWLEHRARVHKSDRKLFDCVLLLVAWSLWKERNTRVFRRPRSAAREIVHGAIRADWALAGFQPYVALSDLWSRNMLQM